MQLIGGQTAPCVTPSQCACAANASLNASEEGHDSLHSSWLVGVVSERRELSDGWELGAEIEP